MKCINCYEELQAGATSLVYERYDSVVRVEVKNLPAQICSACGQTYLDEAVSQQIHDLVDPLLETGKKMMQTSVLPLPTVIIRFPSLDPAQLQADVVRYLKGDL